MSADRERRHKALAAELDELLLREEIMWKQRSRVMWLREGDRNTKFFQRRATWRRKKNSIRKLKKEDGSGVENVKDMQQMATEFFRNLYKADDGVQPNDILELLSSRVTADMNRALTKEYTNEEISNALFQIGPLKAPGADGFHARFFQRNWELVQEDVIKAVKEFFKSGIMLPGTNDTVIYLIAKGSDPQGLNDYRPISLCNVLYCWGTQ